MELQTKNTQLLKKIAELERKVKEGESQIAKKERELQHLQRLGQRDKPHAFQRQNSYEKAITSSQVSESNKDQEIRSLKRQVDTLKWKDQQHVFEVSKYDEEVRQLKESVERLQSQKLAAETDIANASKQAKYFEIQYCTEREHSQRLHDEIKQLQQQLDIAPLSELDDKSSSGEENSAKVIARLQNRIKLLNDNVSKLQEHSVEQSRAVLSLRQQAEVSQVYYDIVLLCVVCCLYNLHVHVTYIIKCIKFLCCLYTMYMYGYMCLIIKCTAYGGTSPIIGRTSRRC